MRFSKLPSLPYFGIYSIAYNKNPETSEFFIIWKLSSSQAPYLNMSEKWFEESKLQQDLKNDLRSLNSNKTQINSFSLTIMLCYIYCFLLKKLFSRFHCFTIFHLQDKFGLLLIGVSTVSVVYVFSNWLYSMKAVLHINSLNTGFNG